MKYEKEAKDIIELFAQELKLQRESYYVDRKRGIIREREFDTKNLTQEIAKKLEEFEETLCENCDYIGPDDVPQPLPYSDLD